MSMNSLVFEKVGDVASNYPYYCVYRPGMKEPFLEFAVTDNKELEFTFYRSERDVPLNLEEWEEIRIKAINFLPKAIADEKASGYL